MADNLNVLFCQSTLVQCVNNCDPDITFIIKVPNFENVVRTSRCTLPCSIDKCFIVIVTFFCYVSSRSATHKYIFFTVLAYQTGFGVLIAMSCLYGFGRSMVIVARNIAISENCKPEQVPAAVGLGMLTMGIIVPPAGYFLGWIRDYTGSYIICITAQNLLLVVLLATWIPDMLLLWIHEKRENKKDLNQIQMS